MAERIFVSLQSFSHSPNRLIHSAQCEAIPISGVYLETRRYPVEHGWMRGTVNNIPVMFPTSVPPTPDYLLRMIKCSHENCGSARYLCLSHALLFTVMNVLTVVMLMCKCQIQMMKRQVTNKGFTMLCQHMYNYCTIVMSANQ